ncbi:MAG: TolB family protein [Povalibacter sp.]
MRIRLVEFLAPLIICSGACADNVEPWQPAGISSPRFESHPAFDPRNGDLYFVRSSPSFEGWRILTSHCSKEGWTPAVEVPFAGDGVEADPYFVEEGRAMYFISTRSTDGIKRGDLDIWRVERDAAGRWNQPKRLPEPVNTTGQEWFPRLGADGWLYFGSSREGGFGKTDIYRAHEHAGKWVVENLGAAINTAADEYEPLIAPDGKSMIVMTEDGLYRSSRSASGWAAKVKLGPQVNVNHSEVGALFSPTGDSVIFARDTKGPLSGEFFIWRLRGNESWPRPCP